MYPEISRSFSVFTLLLGFFFLWVLPFLSVINVIRKYRKDIKNKVDDQGNTFQTKSLKIIFYTFFSILILLIIAPVQCSGEWCGLEAIFLVFFLIINLVVFFVADATGKSIRNTMLRKKII